MNITAIWLMLALVCYALGSPIVGSIALAIFILCLVTP